MCVCWGGVGGRCAVPYLVLRFSGKSDLTVDAVKLHNELQSGSLRLGKSEASEMAVEEEEAPALTEKSSATFLSGLSDCTNVTFSKVQRFWDSNSAAHKEVGGESGWRVIVQRDRTHAFYSNEGFAVWRQQLTFLDGGSLLLPFVSPTYHFS